MNGNDQTAALHEFIRARFERVPQNRLLAAHQQTALIRAVDMIRRRKGAILADEAGMGKSFVAAAAAVVFRSGGCEIEIVVPASLRGQWTEILARFGLDGSSILSHEALHRTEAKIGRQRSKLLIVDEAHRFRNPQTKRYRALCERSIGQFVLLVTATPVCNRLEDLWTLLRIFASDDVLRHEGVPSLTRVFEEVDHQALQRLIEELVIRRTRETMPQVLAFADVQRRVVPFEIGRSGEIAALIDALEFPLIVPPSERGLPRMFLWKRLESSVAAIRESLSRQRRFYRRALEAGSDGCRLTKREFLRIFGDRGEDAPFQELMFRSFWFRSRVSGEDDAADIERELNAIGRILEALEGADFSKLEALTALCAELPDVQILVFTSAIATAKLLYAELRSGRRAAFVSSREVLSRGERCPGAEYVFHQFARGRLDLLVATDLASEGLNLQAAEVVIHYDLPWNPVKLDQRNGRAARIGQKAASVRAYYFVPSDRSMRHRSLGTISRKGRIVNALFGRAYRLGTNPAIRGQTWLELLMRSFGEGPDPSQTMPSRSGRIERNAFIRLREITDSSVVERIAVVQRDGLRFDWDSIGRVVTSGEPSVDADEGVAIEDHRRRLQNRLLVPARTVPGTRVALRRKLQEMGAWGARWAELLSESYPDGIECMIRAAAEDATPGSAEALEPILSASWTPPPSFVRVQNIPI